MDAEAPTLRTADVDDRARTLRAVVAVPLPEELCVLIERLEPRIELVRDHSLTKPMRGPADWSGDPLHRRTPEEQQSFDRMVDSADVLFGIPDVEPQALARTVASNPALRWVMTTAAGGGSQVKDAQLPDDALKRIVFTTSAGVHGGPLAEFAIFGVLAGAKRLPRLLKDQAAHRWPARWEMQQLEDMTVLILGLGGIGAESAQRFKALGATVWASSRSGRGTHAVDRMFATDELASALSEADAVIVTLPGTEQTVHMVDRKFLGSMKRGAILVNVGRGTVVDENALLEALDSDQLSFAALDVFESEPLTDSSRLWNHANVLVSPHTAALSFKEEERIARRFAENAGRLLDERELRNIIDTVEFY